MAKRACVTTLAILLLTVLAGCESRTDRTDSGGVTLSITDFDGLPLRISVNVSNGFVQIESLSMENVVLNPNAPTSSLMNVEIRSYEVTYTRADNGTRLPPKFVAGLFGVVPVGGTYTVDNLPVMGADQFTTTPISDLAFANGGFDKETGSNVVSINFRLRFYGRTVSGDEVESDTANFKVEFVP